MNDNKTDRARLEEFLSYATKEAGGAITFGVAHVDGAWLAVMTAGTQRIEFAPGAGRAFARAMRERANQTLRKLSAEVLEQVGAGEMVRVFDEFDKACLLAMHRTLDHVPASAADIGNA